MHEQKWQRSTYEDRNGKTMYLSVAPDWNESYFRSRFKFKTIEDAIKVLKEVYSRKPDKIAWHIKENEIWIFDNRGDNTDFHGQFITNCNEVVFERLRNGKPESKEWNTGQKSTVEVWST
jgi:hypothetical protein